MEAVLAHVKSDFPEVYSFEYTSSQRNGRIAAVIRAQLASTGGLHPSDCGWKIPFMRDVSSAKSIR